MAVASLQQLVEDYVLKNLTLANVLDLHDFCREVGGHGSCTVFVLECTTHTPAAGRDDVASKQQHTAQMSGVCGCHLQCPRRHAWSGEATFNTASRHVSSVSQLLHLPFMLQGLATACRLEVLFAEMQKTQHEIRRLHLTGRVLERRPATGGSCQTKCSTILPVLTASAGPVLSTHQTKQHKPCVGLKCAKERRALSVTQRHANAVPLTGLALPSAQPALQNTRQPDTDTTALKKARQIFSSRHVYPLSMLMAGMQWPADVDPAHRDQYLSNDEFEAVFGMSRAAFGDLPQWKGRQLKIERGLW